MPGKISELGVLTGATAATTDLIEALDISDTSMAPTGTNKKMSLADVATFVVAQGGGGAPTGTKMTDLVAIGGGVLTSTDIFEVVDVSDTTMDPTGTNKQMTVQNLVDYIGGLGIFGVQNGDKGDITVSGSGLLWQIDGGVVTYAKMQNVSATSRMLGRASAGAGVVEELTVAQVRSMTASGAGAFFGFDFDTTTTAGPAATRLRLNNATPASATIVYVSYTTKDGVELKTRLLAGTAGDRLFMQDRANSANYRVYELTGTPTDNTTYATCAVVHRGGGGTITNLMEIVAGYAAAPFTVGPTAPTSPLTNDLWVDTT